MTLPPLPLPDFVFDSDTNYGVIVIGRAIEEGMLPSPSRVKAVQDAVNAWAARTGLPLALEHAGTTINWSIEDDDDGGERATAMVGLVTAHVDGLGGDGPAVEVPAGALDLDLFARIPAELWTELETRHGVKFGRSELRGDTFVELDEPGVFLLPAGWTVASLYRASDTTFDEDGRPEGRPAITTSSEDTSVGKRLDTAALRDVPLLLWATYC
jgi:hypothetical protein